VGPENALAHASIQALARGEGDGLSPLVVHGPSGVGKSRLLAGLVAERLVRWPGSAVAHLGAESFAASCAEAAGRPGGWSELRGRFRVLDLFVLEDLHALERSPMALAELTHTLDALGDAGAAMAVSARSGPGQWLGVGWPARLVSRLAGGLAVRVDHPGLASRRRYLRERARSQKLNLSAEAVEALAGSADGYRTLDGWLVRLALTARVERRPIDRHLVEPLIAGDAMPPGPTIDQVARAVASAFGVALRDLRSGSRRRSVAGPRHLAMHLARELTGLSYPEVGAYFGGRDPATVRHACRSAAARLTADPALAAAAVALSRRWWIDVPDESKPPDVD
jgi:chromosomal replication initiator protein